MGTKVNEAKGLQVLQAELDLMNKLVLSLVDMEQLVERATDNLSNDVANNPDMFMGFDDEASITEDDLDKYIEMAFQSEYDWTDNIPSIIYEVAHEKFDMSAIKDIETDLKEMVAETIAFQSDPLGYYGMSQRDFI